MKNILLLTILTLSIASCKKSPVIVLAEINTTSITNIGPTYASSGGYISNDGGGEITAKGICWSTIPNPSILDSHSSNGSGIDAFSSNLSNLLANTQYYIRAYVTNEIGTAYGNEINFTTSPPYVLPTLTTNIISTITTDSAICGGNILNDGGSPILQRGVCWSTSVSPTIVNNITSDGTGIGLFASNITGLTMGTTYYLRAYATNNIGTAYGNQIIFSTTVQVGFLYQGGVVAYVDGSGLHGLIAAPNDQSTGIYWHSSNTGITGATGSSGIANTNAILTLYGSETNAAKICADLVISGFSDWYLPSSFELNQIYPNKLTIGGFTTGYYWSSNEYDSSTARVINFNTGGWTNINKGSNYSVRAIRSF